MTFTITTQGRDRIDGFNSAGRQFAAVYNAGGAYNCGRNGETSHATRMTEKATLHEALAWVCTQCATTK
jgi:hypothetical protein